MRYQRLSTPGQIGPISLKNRLVMEPAITLLAEVNGEAGERETRYFEERAKGGVGLIIINANPYRGFGPVRNAISFGSTEYLRSLDVFVDAIHRHGAKVFAQMKAPNPPGATVNGLPLTPSSPPARAMTNEEIKQSIKDMGFAASIARQAGFDGVELHLCHGHFAAQFFSRFYNKRTDEYGGSFENRMRFADELVREVRAAIGPKMALVARISGDEFAAEFSDEHGTLEDGIKIAQYLDNMKMLDALDVSNSNNYNQNANCEPFSYTPGWKKHVAKTIKEHVSLPVIATNTIKTPQFAEQLLQEGVSDFVGMMRGLLADPAFFQKAKEGREEEIRTCIGCMVCRETVLQNNKPIVCSVNPQAGWEALYPPPAKIEPGKTAVVVGAGPAGLQAAITLAERGYHTVLFEESTRPGGLLNAGNKAAFKDNLTDFVNTLVRQARKAGVEMHLGTKATPERIAELKPHGVLLAIGADPVVPRISGIRLPHVHLAEDVFCSGVTLPGKVAVIGTGMTGLEMAETLLAQGSDVTMVDMLPQVGNGIYSVILKDVMSRITPYNPPIYTGHRLQEVKSSAIVVVEVKTGEQKTIPADHVVLALGVSPDKMQVERFKTVCPRVLTVGDASQGGRITEAVREGFARAYVL